MEEWMICCQRRFVEIVTLCYTLLHSFTLYIHPFPRPALLVFRLACLPLLFSRRFGTLHYSTGIFDRSTVRREKGERETLVRTYILSRSSL